MHRENDLQKPLRLSFPLSSNANAMLLIQSGGKVLSVNPAAREWFGLGEKEIPNIERMAKKIRPGDAFLSLCANEGEARLALDGRLIEASSSKLASMDQTVMLVTLHPSQQRATEAATGLSSHVWEVYTRLAGLVGSNRDKESMVLQLLESVEFLFPADRIELFLWEPREACLTPHQLIGLPGDPDRVVKSEIRLLPGEGLAGRIFQKREACITSDFPEFVNLQQLSASTSDLEEFHSFIGMPLTAGNEVLGVLLFLARAVDTFNREDVDTLNLIVPQMSFIVHDHWLRKKEAQHEQELSNLLSLTQGFTEIFETRNLFASLIKMVAVLVPVEVLGFLIFDEKKQVLEGKNPFQGLPPQFVELYHTAIPPNSEAERILLSQEIILSANAAESREWEKLGLLHLSQAASLQETVLIPLVSGGRMLGYLQASNHHNGSAEFSDNELNLLTLAAAQAAPIIENTALLQENVKYSQRTASLRRIASLASSSAGLDDIIRLALRELAFSFEADLALLFLLQESSAALTLHPSSVFGRLHPLPEDFAGLMRGDAQFPFTVTGSLTTRLSVNCSQDDALIPFYREMLSNWQIETAAIAPLVVRDEGIGEIWICSQRASYFNTADAQLLSSAAVQIAALIENARLLAQTDEDMRRRVDHFSVFRHISYELSTSADLDYLLQVIFDEAVQASAADRAVILLFEEENTAGESEFTIRTFIGDTRLEGLTDFEQQLVQHGRPVVVRDDELEAVWRPDHRIRSVFFVPIRCTGKSVGLIALYCASEMEFDDTMQELIHSLASQAGIAIGNDQQKSRLLLQSEQLTRQVKTFEQLFHVSQGIKVNQSLVENLKVIAQGITEVTPFKVVLVNAYDPVKRVLVRSCSLGLTDEQWQELTDHTNSWLDVETLLKPEFRIGQSAYFIPAERDIDFPPGLHRLTLLPAETSDTDLDAWNPQDILFIPLLSASGGPLGLISVDLPVDGQRPDQTSIEALSLFGMQAGLILESHRYLQAQVENLDTLETLRNRLRWDLDNARQEADNLKQTQLQQALELDAVSRQLSWAKAIPEIMNVINRHSQAESYLAALGEEVLGRFGFGSAVIVQNAPSGLRFITSLGEVEGQANIQALLGQQNPLRQVFLTKKPILIDDVKADKEWRGSPLLSALGAAAAVAAPLLVDEKSQFAILLAADHRFVPVAPHEMETLGELARQAEFGLRNLFNLQTANTRLAEVNTLLEFNRKLDDLVPQNILNNLLETVLQIIPAAESAWVGLWDEKNAQLSPAAAHGYPSLFNLLNIRFMEDFQNPNVRDEELSLPLRVCRKGDVLRVGEVFFAKDYLLTPSDLIHYRTATGGKLPLSCLLAVIKRGENIVGVLVIDHFTGTEEFGAQDEILAAALTQQASLALENARLFVESEERSAQMQALTEAAGGISSTMKTEELKGMILQQVNHILTFDTATLWLQEGQHLSIAAVQGFDDGESRIGLSVSIEDSVLFQEMDHTRQPVYIGNVHKDNRFPSIVQHEYLSWLGIPLLAKSELIGVLALEKKEIDFYSSNQIRAVMTFASQAALSLFNARLLEESYQRTLDLDQRSKRLALLNQLSNELIASLDVDTILNATLEQASGALNVSRVAAVLIDEREQFILAAEYPAFSVLPLRLADAPLLQHLRESLGTFISGNVETEKDLLPLVKTYFNPREVKSVLMIPLATPVKLLGWLWLQTEQVYRFSSAEIDLARTMGNQAAIAIQNASLFTETQHLTGDLEKIVTERTEALQKEHLSTQTLLDIINQLSTSLDIDDVLVKTLAILKDALNAEECLILLADGTSRMYAAGEVLVKPPEERELYETSPEQEISAWVLVNQTSLVLGDLQKDQRWHFEKEPGFRSLVAVPLILGEQILGTMFLLHREENAFSDRRLDFVEAAARQISIALNNSELFDLARDQSDRLISMLRDQQIDSSRSFAILEAVADGVVVTDENTLITLFNASAENILGLDASQIIGRSLADLDDSLSMQETGWFEAISRWSSDPQKLTEGVNYAKQFDLDDGRIVLVHLAPVILGEIFLGTVSILRDITQEVMVDRLKSDFIANVSHELRTPLTSIKGYADLMLMGASGELSEHQSQFMRVIRENTRRLNILVNDLLDISHIDAGQLALSFKPVDLVQISEAVLHDIRKRSEQEDKPMQFELVSPEQPIQVSGDPEKIRQVLMNMVSNGYHYTPANGKVIIRLQQNDREAQVDVIDNGIGISEANRERIFNRFFRGDHPFVLATAGTGLGLAISKILIEMHGGRIWFNSSGIDGEGSVFSFTLPLYVED